MGDAGCLVAQDLALLTKVRTRIHEEISLLTVLYFPFRARTPFSSHERGLSKQPSAAALGAARNDNNRSP
jgi:hypothetical protein